MFTSRQMHIFHEILRFLERLAIHCSHHILGTLLFLAIASGIIALNCLALSQANRKWLIPSKIPTVFIFVIHLAGALLLSAIKFFLLLGIVMFFYKEGFGYITGLVLILFLLDAIVSAIWASVKAFRARRNLPQPNPSS